MTDPADDRAPSPNHGDGSGEAAPPETGGEPSRGKGLEPGDRPPPARLSRPPSERYTAAAPGGSGRSGTATGEAAPRASVAGILGPAVVAGIVTAGLIVVIGGLLAEHRGLVFITGLGSGALGLLVARGAASPDGTTPAPWACPEATRIAVGLGLATVLVAALGIWILSRLEGGVMDPLAYLWETTGLLIPALGIVAALAAAVGAGAGPVRWRA